MPLSITCNCSSAGSTDAFLLGKCAAAETPVTRVARRRNSGLVTRVPV
jgi:hypothetical protein